MVDSRGSSYKVQGLRPTDPLNPKNLSYSCWSGLGSGSDHCKADGGISEERQAGPAAKCLVACL